jgi:hypothetical protein
MNLLKYFSILFFFYVHGNIYSQSVMHQKKTDWLGNQYIISTPINTSKSNINPSNNSVDNIIETKWQQISLQDPTSVIGDWNTVNEMVMDPFRGQYPGALTYSVNNAWGANVYYKTSIKGKIMEVLNYMAKVKVIDEKGDWLKVYTPNGNEGWVKSNLLN